MNRQYINTIEGYNGPINENEEEYYRSLKSRVSLLTVISLIDLFLFG